MSTTNMGTTAVTTAEKWNITATDNINNTSANKSSANPPYQPAMEQLDHYSNYPEFKAAFDMYDKYVILFFIVGIIGNALALAVILRKNMRGMSSAIYISILAIFDSLSLLAFLLGMLSDVYQNNMLVTGFCKFFNFVIGFAPMVSTWTVVLMSFERVLVVTFPLKAPNWTSRTKAFIGELLIILFSVLHNIHFFWTATIVPPEIFCFFDYAKYENFLKKYSIYDSVMKAYIPLILVIFFNVVIILQMFRAKAMQQKMSNAPSTKPESRKSLNASHQITIMLVTISVAFVITMAPYSIYQILVTYVWDEPNMSPHMRAKSSLVFALTNMLWMVNHSANFILYTMTGRKFRNEMAWMLTCGAYPARKSHSDATRSTNLRSTNGTTSMTSVNTVSSAVK